MTLAGWSISGPRPYNEDSYTLRDLTPLSSRLGGLRAFLMISDGMGGHQGGDVASRAAISAAESYIDDLTGMAQRDHLSVDPSLALKEIAREANEAVLLEQQHAGHSNMGATLVAALIGEKRAWIAHIGDSRAMLLRDGVAEQLTVDHSQVGRMIAEGILTEEQAQHHPQRNVIERALGFQGAEPEITEVAIRPGDVVLLCSDGLSTVLTGSDMVRIAAGADDADAAVRELADGAMAAGTDDNTTTVVWSDDWSLFRMSVPELMKARRAARRARRSEAKYSRAQKLSWIAMAGLGLLALTIALVAFLGSPRGGGSSAAPVTPAAKKARSSKETSGAATAEQLEEPNYRVPKTADSPVLIRRWPKKADGKPDDEAVFAVIEPGGEVYVTQAEEDEFESGHGSPMWLRVSKKWLGNAAVNKEVTLTARSPKKQTDVDDELKKWADGNVGKPAWIYLWSGSLEKIGK